MRKSRGSKPTFAVVVDGNCEVWYLNMLKRNEESIVVNIEPKIPRKKKLFEQYDHVIQLSKEYTKVFWIVDFDVLTKETKNAKSGSKTAIQSFLDYKKKIEKKSQKHRRHYK